MSQIVTNNQTSHSAAVCCVPSALVSGSDIVRWLWVQAFAQSQAFSVTSNKSFIQTKPQSFFFFKKKIRIHNSWEFFVKFDPESGTLLRLKKRLLFSSSSLLIFLRYWNLSDLSFKNKLCHLVLKMVLGNIFIVGSHGRRIWKL